MVLLSSGLCKPAYALNGKEFLRQDICFHSILNILAIAMSNRVVLEGWFRANRRTLEGSALPIKVFIWNLFISDFTWRAGEFCFAKLLHFVGFTFLPFHSPSFSLSCSLSSHTQSTYSNVYTNVFSYIIKKYPFKLFHHCYRVYLINLSG